MNLHTSIITSLIIVLIIWAFTTIQPNTAFASDKVTTANTVSKQYINNKNHTLSELNKNTTKYINFNTVQISGETKTLSLKNISTLWQTFTQNEKLQNSLKINPRKIYVYYRHFSPNYEKAEVTIGYNVKSLKSAANILTLPNKKIELLLPLGKHSDKQLQQAWQNIDYRKNISALLEVHYLNDANNAYNSEILISYN